MSHLDIRRVLVGIDHTAHCVPAVRVAARHAHALGVGLHLLHVATAHESTADRRRSDPTVAAAELARREVPGLAVHRETVTGAVEFVLRSEAIRASLVVIGNRGMHRRAGRILGSVGTRLAGRTTCPLLIARRMGDPDGPVVVGVDDPPASETVLQEAFRQARLLGRPLHVVHAWHLAMPALARAPATYGHELFGMFQEEAVAAETERIGLEFPDVKVSTEIREGRDRATLIAAAADAALLVIGSQRNPGLCRLVIGTTAMGAAALAACPVLVVPSPRTQHRTALPRDPGRLPCSAP